MLPVLTLSTAYIAYIARLTRGGMLEVLRQDYIRTARAKGLSEGAVVLKHALKLGILPVVSYLGPGDRTHHHGIDRGRERIRRAWARSSPGQRRPSTATTRWCSGWCSSTPSFLMVLNLIVDVAYTRLDPRVELS